jgi:dihydropteroate synthase
MRPRRARSHDSADGGELSTAAGRAFACRSGEELADELQRLGIAGACAVAAGHQPAVVKLRLAAEHLPRLEAAAGALPGVALYTQGSPHGAVDLLLVGELAALHACIQSWQRAAPASAALAQGLRAQLAWLHAAPAPTFVCGGRVLDFSAKTGIMGILNVTPDSFYDGGRYLDPQAALDRAQQMAEEGADIIDVGGQSSRPGSEPVPEAEEARRVLPVVRAVAAAVPALISVDTYRAAIARAALDAGAHLINDISALRFDPALVGVLAERGAPVILMHMQGTPRDMQRHPRYESVVDEVWAFLHERLQAAQAGGIAAERLLVDPGIGFGKGLRHNLEILRKLHHFQTLGRPLVIGTSRKSFIGRILGADVDERLEGTAATVAMAILHGASIVRVHDVRAMARVARVIDAAVRPNFRPPEA